MPRLLVAGAAPCRVLGVGDRRQLWGIRGGAEVVVVYLSGRPYHRLVVDVASPQRTQRDIEEALLTSKKTTARRSLRDLLGEGRRDTIGPPRR